MGIYTSMEPTNSEEWCAQFSGCHWIETPGLEKTQLCKRLSWYKHVEGQVANVSTFLAGAVVVEPSGLAVISLKAEN